MSSNNTNIIPLHCPRCLRTKTDCVCNGLSDLGKRVLATCPRAFVDQWGQVIDPCHVWFGESHDATCWVSREEGFKNTEAKDV